MRALLVLVLASGWAPGCGGSPTPPAGAPGTVFPGEERSDGTAAGLGYAELPPSESVRVQGRALGPDGRPLSDFRVRALSVQPAPWSQECGSVRIERSPDGRFELSGLRPGTLRIEVEADGLAASRAPDFEGEAAGVVRDVEVRLTTGGTLRGRLVDERGEAIAGAEIEARWPFELFERPITRARTDAGGTFSLAPLPAGNLTVRIRSGHHAIRVLQGVSIEDGAPTDLGNVALSPGATIEGRVRDGAGGPVAGARVQLAGAGSDEGVPSRFVLTDDAGRFVLEHVMPGSHSLRASHDHRAGEDPFASIHDAQRTQRSLEVSEGERRSVEIVLEEP